MKWFLNELIYQWVDTFSAGRRLGYLKIKLALKNLPEFKVPDEN